jgi:hypothetical protein
MGSNHGCADVGTNDKKEDAHHTYLRAGSHQQVASDTSENAEIEDRSHA